MSDKTILQHITELVQEEQQLRADPDKPVDASHMRHIEEQLDQCWDLMRQRRAHREFGLNPDDAQVRDPRTVEGYIG